MRQPFPRGLPAQATTSNQSRSQPPRFSSPARTTHQPAAVRPLLLRLRLQELLLRLRCACTPAGDGDGDSQPAGRERDARTPLPSLSFLPILNFSSRLAIEPHLASTPHTNPAPTAGASLRPRCCATRRVGSRIAPALPPLPALTWKHKARESRRFACFRVVVLSVQRVQGSRWRLLRSADCSNRTTKGHTLLPPGYCCFERAGTMLPVPV